MFDWILTDDLALVPSGVSDLVWLSGIEARIHDHLSLSECITSALDTLKGTFHLYATISICVFHIISHAVGYFFASPLHGFTCVS